jgi:hypothetical protein
MIFHWALSAPLSCQLGDTTLHPFPILFSSYQPAPWQPHQGTSQYPSPPTSLTNFVPMCPYTYMCVCMRAQHVQILPLLRVLYMDHSWLMLYHIYRPHACIMHMYIYTSISYFGYIYAWYDRQYFWRMSCVHQATNQTNTYVWKMRCWENRRAISLTSLLFYVL